MTRYARAGCLALTVLLAAGLRPAAAATPIMPLDEVKAGMKGYGRTVFQGSEIEQFDVTVIGVLEGFDFEMDMILIRIDSGPVVSRQWGIIGGMSGSPIYIKGKMIGALAYGWPFQKEPIAGVTPIEQMLWQFDPEHPEARAARVRREQREGRERQPAEQASLTRPTLPAGRLRPAGGALKLGGRKYGEVLVAPNRADAEHARRTNPAAAILAPVATPVYCQGVGSAGMKLIERLFEPYNLVPLQMGGAKVPDNVPIDFSPGAAIAVPITTGDIQLTAVGTLTYRDENVALGFGHPFFGLGKVDLPMSTGYIHTIISSSMSSNKLGGAVREVGRISQDRPTCIGGRMGEKADMLPIRYRLDERSRGAERDFRIGLIRHPALSDMYTVILMQMAMQNVAGGYFDGVTNSHVEIATRVEEGGQKLKVVRNNSFDSRATSGFSMNPLFDLFMTLTLMRRNPWGEATPEAVDVSLTFEDSRRFANIERAQPTQQTAKPGETVEVTVYLKPYGGESRPLVLPVKVPDNAPNGPLLVIMLGGNDAFMLRQRINPPPIPTDVPSLIGWLNNTVRNDSVVVETVLPTMGLEMSGHQLHNLPQPFVDALFTSSVDGMRQIRDVIEKVMPTEDVVSGVAAVMVEVVGEEGPKKEGGDFHQFESPGGGGPEMPAQMNEMLSAAVREVQLLGERGLLGSETCGLLRGPQVPVAAAARLDGILARAAAQARAPAPSRSIRPIAALPPQARPVRRSAAQPADGAEAPAGGEEKPPDITDSLETGKPAKMPEWGELDDLDKGKLDGETPAGAEGEEAKEEDDDGEPLARPVSTWSVQSAEEFSKGRFENTFASNDGRVTLAPAIRSLGTPEAERIWSVLPRDDGSVIVGSWAPRAKLYRVAADGRAELWLETPDAVLQALAPLPDGGFVAGGSPSAKIYKVTGKGKSEVLADLDDQYIWAIVPDDSGGLYVATGDRGRVYYRAPDGKLDVLMDSVEPHVLALCAAHGGGVYAGTYPLGKVYRVTREAVKSVFQAPEAAVLSLAETPSGRLYVGTAGDGQVYRIDPSGASAALTEDEDLGSVYALTHVGETIYAAVAGPGRVLRFDDQDVLSVVYRTDEPFVLTAANADDQRVVGTVAGSGEVVELDLSGAVRGTYLSAIHDAEMSARWGVLRWRGTLSPDARIAFQTRTGNTAFPDRAWSAWSEDETASGGALIESPPGRYIQFRATLYGGPGEVCQLDRVDLFYRTLNRAPVLKIEEPKAGAAVRKTAKIEWEAEDPDDDDLTFDVYYAPVGSDEWQKVQPPSEEEEAAGEGENGEGENGEDGQETEDKENGGEAATVGTTRGAEGAVPYALQPVTALRPVFIRLEKEPPTAPKPGKAEKETAKETPAEAAPEAKEEAAEKSGENGKKKDEKLTESNLEWDTTKVPDGLYRIRVVATDQKRNPDDPKTVEKLLGPVLVDNTGPYLVSDMVGDAPPPDSLRFGEDGCYLSSAEYRFDDGEWTALLPADGIFDSRFETIARPKLPTEPGEHTLTIRVRDAVGNVSRFEWTFAVADGAQTEETQKPKE